MSELDLCAPDDKSQDLDLALARALLREKLAPALSGKRFVAIVEVSSDLNNDQLGEFACVLIQTDPALETVGELQSSIRTSHVNGADRVDRVDRVVASETLDYVSAKFVALLAEHGANPQNTFCLSRESWELSPGLQLDTFNQLLFNEWFFQYHQTMVRLDAINLQTLADFAPQVQVQGSTSALDTVRHLASCLCLALV